MKKVLTVLSGITFIMLMTLAVNAQDPQKKTTDKKAKTEQNSKTENCTGVKKDCSTKSCDKKVETKKDCDKKVEKK